MPDICMCHGNDCPLRDKCYRYKATADEIGQVFFATPPFKEDKCEHFWEDTGQKSVTWPKKRTMKIDPE